MSHAEGRSSAPSEEEEEEGSSERATPISAIAPEADSYEQPAVISSNPALQCLEQVK